MKNNSLKLQWISTFFCLCTFSNCSVPQNNPSPEAILQQRHKEIYAMCDSLVKKNHACGDSLKTHKTKQDSIRVYAEIAHLNKAIVQSRDNELQLDFEFIRNNPSSKMSIDLIYYRVVNREYTNSYDTFFHYYNLLSNDLKSSEMGETLNIEFINWKNSLVGSYAKDFSLNDADDKQITLSSYRNKSYVLLDFWGVHCGPCRHGMPYLKELYSKYHNKGLEIIGISPDYDLDNWRQAIKQDGTNIWRQVSERQNKAEIFKEFYAKAMPVKILINKQGLIVGRWYGGGIKDDADLAKKLEIAFGM